MWTSLKPILAFFVLQCMIQRTFALVSNPCSTASECDDGEECTANKCLCKAKYLNTGNGTCVYSYCRDNYDCSEFANTVCTNKRCVCNVLSVEETADNYTKGTCVAKNCKTVKECGGDELGVVCNSTDTGSNVCFCKENLEPFDKLCVAKGLDEACTGDPHCSKVDHAVCVGGVCKCKSGLAQVHGLCKESVGTCSNAEGIPCNVTDAECADDNCFCPSIYTYVEKDKACKIAAGESCYHMEKQCVSNARCIAVKGHRKVCECDEGFTHDGNFCVSPNGGAKMMSFVGFVLASSIITGSMVFF